MCGKAAVTLQWWVVMILPYRADPADSQVFFTTSLLNFAETYYENTT